VQRNFSGILKRAALAATAALALAAAPAAAYPLMPTTTSVVASPNPAMVNTTVTYTAEVISVPPSGMEMIPPAPGGTVLFAVDDVPIPGCQAIPLVNGTASCQGPAGNIATSHGVTADYSGDSDFAPSHGWDDYFVIGLATVAPSVAPNPVIRRDAITYKAAISGIMLGGAITPAAWDVGTIAYYVDGEPVPGCAAQPVDHHMKSSCASFAPAVGGTHELKTVYSGSYSAGANSATTPFVVLAPTAALPEAVDFGPVTVGAATTRTVTLTNAGKVGLRVDGAALKAGGPFNVAADGCAEKTLAEGETCDVTVAFRPGAAEASSAKLGFHHDGEGPSSVVLSGTGTAAPAPPAPPVVDPPKQPGGTLAPGAKPTLTVSIPSSGSGANASSVPVLSLPLSCPANEECLLNGTLKVNTSTLSKSARAAATRAQTVARFSKVQVEAGGLKTIKLKLSPKFVKSAQKRGVRRIKATLTINTVLGSGQRITKQQRVTILLPKAAKKKRATQKVRPRFTG
jgi:hypothetical protein